AAGGDGRRELPGGIHAERDAAGNIGDEPALDSQPAAIERLGSGGAREGAPRPRRASLCGFHSFPSSSCGMLPRPGGAHVSAARVLRTAALLDQDVAAGATIENVVAGIADEHVVAGVTQKGVVPGAADQHVVALTTAGRQLDGV